MEPGIGLWRFLRAGSQSRPLPDIASQLRWQDRQRERRRQPAGERPGWPDEQNQSTSNANAARSATSSTLRGGCARAILSLARFQQRLQIRDRLLVADCFRLGRARFRRLAGRCMCCGARTTRQFHHASHHPVVIETRTRNVRRCAALDRGCTRRCDRTGRGTHRGRTYIRRLGHGRGLGTRLGLAAGIRDGLAGGNCDGLLASRIDRRLAGAHNDLSRNLCGLRRLPHGTMRRA